MNTTNPAVVLGMFETGLGVVRSLGRRGIEVYGLDFKRDVGHQSRYVKPVICPHPLDDQERFVAFLVSLCSEQAEKPVVFVTSDDFVTALAHRRDEIAPHCLFNLPSPALIDSISDKYRQYQLAKTAGTPVPETFLVADADQVPAIRSSLHYPVFIKALDVNLWRKMVGARAKGFVATNAEEFTAELLPILDAGVKAIAQEIIEGPDTNHCKFCAYYAQDGTRLLGFTLRKIRQTPIRFGTGAVVESIEHPMLASEGDKLFRAIGYRGVGSAEFKLDNRDGELKLIEINPRYWQQNSLPAACGMDFAYVDYLECTGQQPAPLEEFKKGIKWVNRRMDLDSFMAYRREGELGFRDWRRSLRGPKIDSKYASDDRKPALHELGFGTKLFKLPGYLLKGKRFS